MRQYRAYDQPGYKSRDITLPIFRLDVEGVLRANSASEWESQLEFALDPENYQRLSAGLRERMQGFADVDDCAAKFLQFAAS